MNKKYQAGLTLVEMMIAFTLSALLVLGLTQIFNSNKEAFRLQDGLARIQESGRLAMEFIARETRNAGYMGCASGNDIELYNNVKEDVYGVGSALQESINAFGADNNIIAFDNISDTTGTELAKYGLVVGTAKTNIVSGTDAIIFQGAGPCKGGDVVQYNSGGGGTAQFKIADAEACGLNQDDIVIVTNCTTADMFGITNNPTSGGTKDTIAHGSNLNNGPKLNGIYDDDSYIFRFKQMIFYVAYGESGEPALYMKTLTSAANTTKPYENYELAEGVEDMQLQYLYEQGANLQYVEADLAGFDSKNVRAIKTNLLIRSDTGVTSFDQTYNFAGATASGTDGRFRVPYMVTTHIRNRVN